MAELSVSIITIREGLQTLAVKGMVMAEPKVAMRVIDESRWTMFDAEILAWRLETGAASTFLGALFETGHGLKSMAAALAVAQRTEDDVAHLSDLATRFDVASQDKVACVNVDLEFHRRILASARNAVLHSLDALIGTALTASSTFNAPTRRPEAAHLAPVQHERLV